MNKLRCTVKAYCCCFVLCLLTLSVDSTMSRLNDMSSAKFLLRSRMGHTHRQTQSPVGKCIKTTSNTCSDSTECVSDPDYLSPCDGDYECVCQVESCACVLKNADIVNREDQVNAEDRVIDGALTAQNYGAQDLAESGLKRIKAGKLLTKFTGPVGKLLTPFTSFYKGFRDADGSVVNKLAHGTVGSCKELDDMAAGAAGGIAGGKAGVAVGGLVGAVPGAAVGGFIGGVAGGIAASLAYDGTAADKIADKKCEDQLCAIKCKMGKVKSWFGGDHDQEGCLAKCHEEKQEEISAKESEIMAQVQIGKENDANAELENSSTQQNSQDAQVTVDGTESGS